MKEHRILFVCHGNICRSPMAEFIMKDLVKDRKDFYIESKATSYEEIGNSIYPSAKRVLRNHNIPFSERSAKRMEKSDYEKYDYIIIMDSNNERNIMRIIGDDKDNKVHKLLSYTGSSNDISDPWYTGEFEKCYNEIYKGCMGLLNYIDKN